MHLQQNYSSFQSPKKMLLATFHCHSLHQQLQKAANAS
ncbi:hypothetical protein MTR67_018434 [Solanum verrucosum]|uniref:Uncharacterized protein n=1 Tax=Solanum verrucosum TaxID=315347 RepID=A0AAF0QJP6_SOLVR|nr:hypothetical protein MTR67_018434 [Solanum verrucosum]